MHYRKRCFTFYPSVDHLNHTKSYLLGGWMTKDTNGYWSCEYYQVLPTGWMDDQGYRRVPGLVHITKSYLWGRQMTKDTDGYLVLQILLSPT